MKKVLFLLTLAGFAVTACTSDFDEKSEVLSNETVLPLTRAAVNDSVALGELVPLEVTEKMLEMKKLYDEWRSSQIELMAASQIDEFFNVNMVSIKDLPVTIQVRTIAAGSTADYDYLTCSGTQKEVKLGKQSSSDDNLFYVKKQSALTGVPYLIYSKKSNTPLAVGYYEGKEEDKVLMSMKDNSNVNVTAGWDLYPSDAHRGYFSIQNEYYMGQADPNDIWSYFYYVLEAKSKNKIGYAQRVANKGEQEFLITPINKFSIKNIDFDTDNATLTSAAPITIKTTTDNIYEYPTSWNTDTVITVTETSMFNETKGHLNFQIDQANVKFKRPKPVGGAVRVMQDAVADAAYSATRENIGKDIEVPINIPALEPRSYADITITLKTFNITVPYTATAEFKGHEVKVKGTWRGYAVADINYYKPEYSIKFTSLDSSPILARSRRN